MSESEFQTFIDNNPWSGWAEEDRANIISKPWGSNQIQLVVDKQTQSGNPVLGDLAHICLPRRLFAIVHLDTKIIEFIYDILDPNDKEEMAQANRDFHFSFESATYYCKFAEPSERLYRLAGITVATAEGRFGDLRRLMPFRDLQRIDSLPADLADWLKSRLPRSFFVECPAVPKADELVCLCQHLNILMRYYDRRSPLILIEPSAESPSSLATTPTLRFVDGAYPTTVAMPTIDDFYLQILEAARIGNPRYRFVLYYQIIEYAAFYHIEDDVRNHVRRLLRRPSVVNGTDETISEILTAITPTRYDDGRKMGSVIKRACDMSIIWREITTCKSMYTQSVAFEGGFEIDRLISDDMSEDAWCATGHAALLPCVKRIRNAIVHARESREHKVILPGPENDRKLRPYLRLIERVAEQLALTM